MDPSVPVKAITEFLGSAQIFTQALEEVLDERVRSAADGALTRAQVKLLQLVAHTDARTISDVAAFLGISTAAASKSVDRLVRRGFFHRQEAPGDRRSIHLSLTDEGRSILSAFTVARDRALSEFFEPVPPEDLKKAAEVLDRLSLHIVQANTSTDVCFRCNVFFRDKCVLRESAGRSCYRHLRLDPPEKIKRLGDPGARPRAEGPGPRGRIE